MVRTKILLLVCAVTVAAVFGAPAAACAANAYGQTFGGQAKCLECHGNVEGRWQTGTYVNTAHGQFVTDVQADQSKLVPKATDVKLWPSASAGGGYTVGPTDMWLMLGGPGQLKEYAQKYRNDATHTISTGRTIGPLATAPADDWWFFDPIAFSPTANQWELEAPVVLKTYFQGCGGCHNLAVTRPSDTTYTLPGGAEMSHSTETSYSGLGIQCENCHGTGSTANGHWGTVGIARTKTALDSQVCGQCHATMTARQKNYAGTGYFSQPNGYTADKKLADFVDVYGNMAGSSFLQTSPTAPKPVIPANEKRYYPDGHNKSGGHFYYNEWMLTPHARSLRWADGTLWSPDAKDECLPCHSGEGFLKSIGYGSDGPNDIALFASKVASDTLDIECAVCHTVHAKTGDALGLRLPADELCVKCHNGGVTEGEDAVAPSRPQWFPQKEMFEGYGLIGVAESEEPFMPDAECVSCHMTYTRIGRISHNMKPMLPGNAAAWNVPTEGDACTPCHGGTSRTALQAKIDGWQSDVREAAEEASAAVAAARLRPQALSGSGPRFIDAAVTNIRFVEGDGSSGVHNYPYAMAGLGKASYLADSIGAGYGGFGVTSFDPRAGMAMVYGKLVFGDGSVREGERVVIEALPGGTSTWVKVATVSTFDSGDFAAAVAPKGTTQYRAVWTPLDDASAVRSSAAKIVFGSSTSIKSSVSRLALGRTVTFSGVVAPAHSGSRVTLQYWSKSGWRTLTSGNLSATSAYAGSWRTNWRGTVSVRAVFGGDGSHAGSTSGIVKVAVY